MDVFEAAELIDVTPQQVRYLLRKGTLAGELVAGKAWLVERQSAEEYARLKRDGEIRPGPDPVPKPPKGKRGRPRKAE